MDKSNLKQKQKGQSNGSSDLGHINESLGSETHRTKLQSKFNEKLNKKAK